MIIYQILFPNGKSYIGKTIDATPSRRLQEHKHSPYPVGNAIRKYGFENIIVNILQDNIPNIEMLNTLEKYYISTNRSLKTENGYNIRAGGDGGDITAHLTPEQKEDMYHRQGISRKKTMDMLTTEERQEKFGRKGDRNGMFGKTHSTEVIEAARVRSKEYKNTPEQVQRHLDVKKKHRGENSWNTKYSKDEWLKIYDEVKNVYHNSKKVGRKIRCFG